MPIDEEQAKTIKAQLLKQIESYPEDKRDSIKEYVESMDNQELEEFLIQNKLIKTEGSEENKKPGSDCIYCLLSSKVMPSLSIYEDKDYLAALEIKPISPGHIVLIPKEHVKETKNLKPAAFTLSDKIGKHLIKQLNAENFQISSSDELKHAIINIIPIYKGKELNYKRTQENQKQLQEIAIKIGQIKKSEKRQKSEKKTKVEIEVKKSVLSYPRRIP